VIFDRENGRILNDFWKTQLRNLVYEHEIPYAGSAKVDYGQINEMGRRRRWGIGGIWENWGAWTLLVGDLLTRQSTPFDGCRVNCVTYATSSASASASAVVISASYDISSAIDALYLLDVVLSRGGKVPRVMVQTPLHGHRLRTCCTAPPTDTTNGRAHNNSATNLPHRNATAQHLDMSRCWDVANFCPFVVTLLYNKL